MNSRLVSEAAVVEQSSGQPDRELVSLAKQGDKAAFGQLVLRYQPMAQQLAFRVLGDRDLAQELVQESMLQAYLALDKLHDPDRFKSWLYGIVLNLGRNDLRRRKLMCFSLEAMIGDVLAEPLMTASSPDPQILVEQSERSHTVRSAVDQLSAKNRSAILLFYDEQFSLQEVADHLNISVNAVKGRLHKSRQQLRSQLTQLQDLPASKETQIMSTHSSQEINPMVGTATVKELSCSFCGKRHDQVAMLIAGPPTPTGVAIYICNECVSVCNKIISAEIPPLTQPEIEQLIGSGRLD